MEIYRLVEFNIPEPHRFGNKTDSTIEDLNTVREDVKISSKFNEYLNEKSGLSWP